MNENPVGAPGPGCAFTKIVAYSSVLNVFTYVPRCAPHMSPLGFMIVQVAQVAQVATERLHSP